MKRFVSVWFPAFPIERMRRDEPGCVPRDGSDNGEPPSIPFALVSHEARGQIITALNAEGLKSGLMPGLALADARARLPGLAVREAAPDRDRRALLRLAHWAGRYGPSRNVDGADGLWIDITGVAHLFVEEQPFATSRIARQGWSETAEKALLADLVRRLAGVGLTARIGLADTLDAAHALARFGRTGPQGCLIAPPDASRRVLASLPVEALQLDTGTIVLLKRFGLKRIGQLYDLPRAALARRFMDATAHRRPPGDTIQVNARSSRGKRSEAFAGAVLAGLDAAIGTAAEPRRPLATPAQFSARRLFAEPLISSEGVEVAVASLCDELAAALAAAGRGAGRLILALYRSDATRARIDIGLSAASRDPQHFAALLLAKVTGFDAGFGIDALVLDARRVEPLAERQQVMVHGALPKPHQTIASKSGTSDDAAEAVGTLIDRLINRLGANRVLRLLPHDSHLPERAASLVPALGIAPCHPPSAHAPASGASRPLLLLSRPEPITVLAEIPEGPPARFTWRRLTCRIVKAEGPERIAPEWWRALPPPAKPTAETGPPASPAFSPGLRPPPRSRDYYTVEDAGGARYWLYRDGRYDDNEDDADVRPPIWFLHGLAA